ncbi:hypothetical protein K737_301029 [Holospora undulata HU1]|uniref:Uncharacterized protein n=1 Tax=Holospora undulata HU1 TaxID=1321371 RepID=A0A061JH14_9PROT|nr:hypothetical protein K737_301029 [Holospora undulata HU1]
MKGKIQAMRVKISNLAIIIFIQSCQLKWIVLPFLIFGVWRSLVARLLWEQNVGGSNPFTPTPFVVLLLKKNSIIMYLVFFLFDICVQFYPHDGTWFTSTSRRT